VPFAGFAEAARRLVIGVTALAGLAAGMPAQAQNQKALEWYTQGLSALEAKNYSLARADLMQAVQADPSFAGAWLDLAIATEADGDPVEAEEFLGILEARFAVPPGVEQKVAQLRSRIDRQKAIAARVWEWSSTFQTGLGIDTNANTGLALSDLTLTFPAGPVVLPISSAQLPRRDSYFASSIATEGSRQAGTGQYDAAGSIRSRVNDHLHDYDTVELQAAVGYTSSAPAFGGRVPFATGPWRIGATAQQLRLGGSVLLDSVTFNALHAWTTARCSPQGGAEFGMRHFPVANNLDSHLYWLTGSATCSDPWAGPGASATAQVRLGYESGRGNFETPQGRPGDDTRHLELTLLQRWAWTGPHGPERVEAQFQWAQAADTRGYSPLLASNATRRLARWTGSLSYTVPLGEIPVLGSGWMAVATAQAFRQRSNLELFRLNGEILQLSLQRNW
jgi:hypothetical protein